MRRYDWKRWLFSSRIGYNVSLGFLDRLCFFAIMAFTIGQFANATESKTSVIEQSSLTRDLACNTSQDCIAAIRGGVKCSHKLCVCDAGYTRFNNNCLKAKDLHEPCEISEQCAMKNINSYCPSSDTLDAKPSNCKCRKGYSSNVLNLQNQCAIDPDRGGLGIYGNPHFDTRDLVPIIMGCLAAGLALCACCAGIVQLMRKKRSLQWRTECEIPQELIYFGSDVNHYVTPHNTGFPGPESLHEQNLMVVIPERFQTDLPPSYDEAIIPPSYEEAMKRVKTADTNL